MAMPPTIITSCYRVEIPRESITCTPQMYQTNLPAMRRTSRILRRLRCAISIFLYIHLSLHTHTHTALKVGWSASAYTFTEGGVHEVCVRVFNGTLDRNITVLATTHDFTATGMSVSMSTQYTVGDACIVMCAKKVVVIQMLLLFECCQAHSFLALCVCSIDFHTLMC